MSFSKSGSLRWASQPTYNRSGGEDTALDIAVGCAGSAYVTGRSFASSPGLDATTLKYVLETATGNQPDYVQVVIGTQYGVLSDLYNSDNQRFAVQSDYDAAGQLKVQFIVESTLNTTTPSELCLMVEAYVNTTSIRQRIEVFNFDLGSYDLMDVRMSSLSDMLVEIPIVDDPARYVNSGGKSRARITFEDLGALIEGWYAYTDWVHWKTLN